MMDINADGLMYFVYYFNHRIEEYECVAAYSNEAEARECASRLFMTNSDGVQTPVRGTVIPDTFRNFVNVETKNRFGDLAKILMPEPSVEPKPSDKGLVTQGGVYADWHKGVTQCS